MYAVIESGGKQYRVQLGTELQVDRLDISDGGSVVFDRVLLVSGDDVTAIGQPLVDGASVIADVLGQDRGEKIVVFKYKPKARRRVKKGFRAALTTLRVSDITFDGRSAAASAEKAAAERERAAREARQAADAQAAADRALAERLAAESRASEPDGGEQEETREAPADRRGRGGARQGRTTRPPSAAAAPDQAPTDASPADAPEPAREVSGGEGPGIPDDVGARADTHEEPGDGSSEAPSASATDVLAEPETTADDRKDG